MWRVAVTVFAVLGAYPFQPAVGCEVAELPQLTIDEVRSPAVPVIDTWQVLLDDTPISDAQLAMLARNDVLIDAVQQEIERRGTWVYIGTMLAAGGTAISSTGWVLYGQNELPQVVTLPLAIGGILTGVFGLLTISHALQVPLEPHLAPTPEHRVSREEARRLVASINRRWRDRACGIATPKPQPTP